MKTKENEESSWLPFVRKNTHGSCQQNGSVVKKERTPAEKQKAIEALYSIDTFDNKLIDFITKHPETTEKQRAEYMNCSQKRVRNAIQKPGFQRAMREIAASTMDILEEGQRLAALKVQELIGSYKEEISLQACKLVLQPLFVKKEQIELTNVKQVIHEVRFGKAGDVISSREDILEIEDTTQLLLGEHYTESNAHDERTNDSGENQKPDGAVRS